MSRAFVFLLALANLAPAVPTWTDPTTLHEAAKALARDVKTLLESRKATSVSLGEIKGPVARAATGGPAVQQALKAELERLGVKVGRTGDVGIDGTFRSESVPSDHPDEKMRGQTMEATVIELRVTDEDGKEIARLQKQVLDEADQAALEGRSVDVPVNAGRAARDEAVKEARKKPAKLQGSLAKANEKSPFGIEILVGGAPVSLEIQDTLTFARLKEQDEYQVRVTNEADFEVAVTLSIDGLSMFEFCDERETESGRPRYSSVVVGPKSTATIRGWHITMTKADAFRIVPREDSAAHRLGQTQNMGTITAVFRAAWKEQEAPPEGELMTTSRKGVGTGRGSKVDQNVESVRRMFGRVRAAVSIRYDR